ncbi:4-hydroxyphenylpyruvate dioxygenase [Waterburya agarophytonicola K14]|uniref:4-hydroxyphenylpyruvate dioxygenase n=1 Tax=Waterburya agarophytonicola KI4 TaxID=2874699 RepID=A0A964BU81_9CYAN|nr:4-hydroxyphenylpyruvate dioxygenase [Waterburya agarophytonicola]MCC0178321.1 4-hydroxyphenylpyruvate dioxygenase [Waterburya agarophytonicola KI4]
MKIDRIHFYTRDAAKIKDWFTRNVGFNVIGNSNNQHTHTEVISLNSACLVFSSPLTKNSPVASYLNSHPSGVGDITFRVKDIQSIVDRAYDLGLNILQDPQTYKSDRGIFRAAQIQGWKSLRHTLIEETDNNLDYCFSTLNLESQQAISNSSSQITDIDHVVLNVAAGKLNSAVKLYQDLFGFKIQQSFNIQTPTSGLYSQALIDDSGAVQFNINEPTSNTSQIQEFIDLNHGSGIQHLALRSQNLIADVQRMQDKDLAFLTIPQIYYNQLDRGINLSPQEWQAIAREQILVDCDRNNPRSLLMQIFTQPIFEQPTFFLEFIERRQQAQGFGKGNFKALFEAVEREQIMSNSATQ